MSVRINGQPNITGVMGRVITPSPSIYVKGATFFCNPSSGGSPSWASVPIPVGSSSNDLALLFSVNTTSMNLTAGGFASVIQTPWGTSDGTSAYSRALAQKILTSGDIDTGSFNLTGLGGLFTCGVLCIISPCSIKEVVTSGPPGSNSLIGLSAIEDPGPLVIGFVAGQPLTNVTSSPSEVLAHGFSIIGAACAVHPEPYNISYWGFSSVTYQTTGLQVSLEV